jgi:hypothetical protein
MVWFVLQDFPSLEGKRLRLAIIFEAGPSRYYHYSTLAAVISFTYGAHAILVTEAMMENPMAQDSPPPNNRPEPGYYYHYKHNPEGPVNNYAYYIYGVGHHTEDDCRPEDAFMQVYRPLYESAYVYRSGGMFDLRPLHMFYEPAEWHGQIMQRFTKITDPAVIALLQNIRAKMYPDE